MLSGGSKPPESKRYSAGETRSRFPSVSSEPSAHLFRSLPARGVEYKPSLLPVWAPDGDFSALDLRRLLLQDSHAEAGASHVFQQPIVCHESPRQCTVAPSLPSRVHRSHHKQQGEAMSQVESLNGNSLVLRQDHPLATSPTGKLSSRPGSRSQLDADESTGRYVPGRARNLV